MSNRWPSAQPWSSMTRYNGTDCLINQHDVQPLGFDASLSEAEMIALAIQHKSPVIVKAGFNAKWYLKGSGVPYEYLERMIKENQGKERYQRCYVILIKFE